MALDTQSLYQISLDEPGTPPAYLRYNAAGNNLTTTTVSNTQDEMQVFYLLNDVNFDNSQVFRIRVSTFSAVLILGAPQSNPLENEYSSDTPLTLINTNHQPTSNVHFIIDELSEHLELVGNYHTGGQPYAHSGLYLSLGTAGANAGVLTLNSVPKKWKFTRVGARIRG